ncbi:MAG TPA: sugar ABC transporter permease [Thermotogota bacterium]|jgi:multiple sugar transport system permease protein|nr:sugar ABC transporter permease [Thermotogota bacterium]NLH18509.1 sugar ABC transporter permease [Thermotogaceae bacterium]OQC31879.1 MAG: sn-glycerol-3-phosphate transport system permease protein UgpA [Thermotogota bacterium ADurb.Bin062]HNW47485.1 sugar ABC transporter permease [Thermotogota bacterium]HOD91564.1 sugar ABC transporter permease [Thermotogota bacterium]
MKLRQKKTMTAYLFLLIPLVFFVFVRFVPTIYAFWLSLTDWNIISPKMNFVGLDNFRELFSDTVFLKALGNTFKYVLYGVPLVLALSFVISLLLNAIQKGQAFYRLIYVMPYITPLVAVSWVWRWMYQRPPIGVINGLLSFVGLPTQRFLFSMDQALIAIVVTTVWVNLGYCVVIFLAGLQTIPREYLEASKIDGANRLQVLTKITIPLLNPVIVFLVVTQSILFLRIFTQVYNMTDQGSGGPLNSTKPLVLYIYQKAFLSFEMGAASSATVVLFGIILLITLLQFQLLKRRIQY